MNILVVGNGFDLAHGLPTTYMDFLQFIYNAYLQRQDAQDNDFIKEKIMSSFRKILRTRTKYGALNYSDDELSRTFKSDIFRDNIWEKYMDSIKNVLVSPHSNLWLIYFKNKSDNMCGDNWIDFESEISTVTKWFEQYQQGEKICIEDPVVKNLGLGRNSFNNIIIDDLRRSLEKNLQELIDCLELYILLINKIPPTYKSPNIENLDFSKILSFNYTDTFAIVYKNQISNTSLAGTEFDFIHGKAGEQNLVLGTEETLREENDIPEQEKLINKDISCIRFKKYFQRIYKQTGLKYKHWLGSLDQVSLKKNIYIFGHSLDTTDKDVLNYIITHPSVENITIFYHDEEAYARYIANLVKVIGKDEMIQRAGNGNIKFEKQEIMHEV
jgi:hypothetical protein